MAPILYLSPSNDAAITHLRAQVARYKAGTPLGPVHLLLPSARVIARLRRELGNTINIHFLQFYALARAVLNAARQERIHEIRDTAARRLVRHLLAQMAAGDQLSTFAPVWQKPGFTDLILGWLREVKSQGIHPAEVTAEAARTGTDRDRQLAHLYQNYQDFLHQENLSDADGLLWLAAENLAQQPDCFRHAGPSTQRSSSRRGCHT